MAATKRYFLIYSPGRSGSTAIADELSGTRSVVCFQEPIISIDSFPDEDKGGLIDGFREGGIETLAQRRNSVHRYGTVKLVDPTATPASYLDMVEHHKGHTDKLAVGFKSVKGQIETFPDFWPEIAKRGYIAFCLTRRNFVKAALSAVIARQKGFYNTEVEEQLKEYREQKVVVPVDMLGDYITEFKDELRDAPNYLRKLGFVPHKFYYEDFLADREQFYLRMFDILGLPFEMPEKSTFKKLVPADLRDFIENHAEVEKFLKRRRLYKRLDAL
jgi:hypothetical protein